MIAHWLWFAIWMASEKTGISLGRFAPYVFSQMIGRKGHIVRHHTWQWLIDWCGRMAAKYGGTVYDGNKRLDWGQAMCRQAFGPDWMNDDDFKSFDNSSSDEPASGYVIEVCKRWESGEWPQWAKAGDKS